MHVQTHMSTANFPDIPSRVPVPWKALSGPGRRCPVRGAAHTYSLLWCSQRAASQESITALVNCIEAGFFSQAVSGNHKPSHKDMLRRIYAHPLFMTRNQIARSISHAGDEARLRTFMEKLVTGQPVTVVTLGGSITAGHGTENEPDWWPSRIFTWINQTFPHPDHRFLNNAVPATTSSYVAPCVSTLVPSGTDIIFLEYTLNDSAEDMQRADWERRQKTEIHCDNSIDSSSRRTMERMVRELMTLHPQAAIMGLHAWAPNFSIAAIQQRFFDGPEDYYTTIFAYYGVTVFSFRNTMAAMLRKEPELVRRIWVREDDFHPSCIGTRFMADMIIGYLMDHLANAVWTKHAQMVFGIEAAAGQTSQVLHVEAGENQLPPALFDGNSGEFTTQCILEKQLPQYIAENSGFLWLGEDEENGGKLGYESHIPSSHLLLKVPLSGIRFNGEDVIIGLGILISWRENMGVVEAHCVSGCTCAPHQFSTLLAHAGWSMTFWQFVQAKVSPGSLECTMKLIDSYNTFGQGHRVRFSSFLVSGEMGTLSSSATWLQDGIVSEMATAGARRLLLR